MKANSRVQTFLSDLRLPSEERKAARQERRAEEAMRSQRDNVAYSETARKAAAEAKRQREGAAGGSGLGPSG
jgi:membrane protein involved in colicin uptake